MTTVDPHAQAASAGAVRGFEVQQMLGTSTHSFADATDASIAALCATGVRLAWYEISRLSGTFRHGAPEVFEALLTVGQGDEPERAAVPLPDGPEWGPPVLGDPEAGSGGLDLSRYPGYVVVGVHEASFSQAAVEGVTQAGRLFEHIGMGDRQGRFEVTDMSGRVVDGRRAEYRITMRVWPL